MCKHCTVRREALDRLYRFSRDAQTDRRRALTLTDEELEAVEQAAGVCELDATDERRLEIAATLRGLLERTGGER